MTRLRNRRRALLLLAPALAAAVAVPALAAKSPRATNPIRHVWLINIENKSYDEAWVTNPNPYLPKTLRAQGQLLRQYYGIGHLSLTNYIAQLSGQAPTLDTNSDCQIYRDQVPGTPGPDGQSIGQGCVYPTWVQTLPDQLDAKGLSWKGYMEDMGNDDSREPDRCGSPSNPTGAGFRDGTQSASATDQYAARHNPFVYFHSILDSGRCETNVVPLPQMQTDLGSSRTTPAFSFITPDLCHDGHDEPCADGGPGGLKAVDGFLKVWVPRILSSEAYQDGGLLIISADEAENSDSTACCNEQSGYNTPAAGGGGITAGSPGPGGGRIGTLVIGRCVVAGSSNDTPYNHYSLLRSLEDVFGITTGGADGKGHLGYAGQAGLKAFGTDVFAGCATKKPTPTAAGTVTNNRPAAGALLADTGGLGAPGLATAALLFAAGSRRLTAKGA